MADIYKKETKKVVQRTIQDDQGRTRKVYIDLKTYKEVPADVVEKNGGEYYIVNPNNQFIEPVADISNPNVPSQTHTFEELNKSLIEGHQMTGHEPIQVMPGDISNAEMNAASRSVQKSINQPDLNAIDQSKTPPSGIGAKRASIGAPVGGGVDPSTPSLPDTGQASTPSINSPQNRPDNYSYGGPLGKFDTATTNEQSPNRPNENITARAGPTGQFDVHGAEKGKGFAALADPAGNSNITYSNENAQRNEKVRADTEARLSKAVEGYFGPGYHADIVSGKGVMKDENGDPSKKGNHNHPFGTAADFDVVDNTTGIAVGPDEMSKFGEFAAANAGFTGIGGPGYMGAGRMHLDTQHKNLATWGGANKANIKESMDRGFAFPGSGAPIPSARPEMPNSTAPSTNYAGPVDVAQGDFSAPSSIAQGIVDQAKTPGFDAHISEDISNASPAKMDALGIGAKYTPQDMANIGFTIAGELQHALPDLASPDPNKRAKAQAEAAGMVTSIANRAESQKFKTLDAALTPSQYNSLMPDNLDVTKNNFAKYQHDIMGVVQGTLDGTIQPPNYDITSYHNPAISHPAWGSMMDSPSSIGQHKFGVLSEYSPTRDFQANRERMSMAQQADPEGFTGHPDYAGNSVPGFNGLGYSSHKDSPTEGGPGRFGGIGLGNGDNSPSEGGTHFGGSGLGSPSGGVNDGNKDQGSKSTGYGIGGTSGQSVGPSGGGKSWGGPH